MKYWVVRNGHVVGWVIAASAEEAARLADEKYPPSWLDDPTVVQLRTK